MGTPSSAKAPALITNPAGSSAGPPVECERGPAAAVDATNRGAVHDPTSWSRGAEQPKGSYAMRSRTLLLMSAAIALASTAHSNESQLELQQNPELWAVALGNYQGHRHSRLDQINRDNIDDLRVAWQFSTGVLRGHEGGPLGDARWMLLRFEIIDALAAESRLEIVVPTCVDVPQT
jgi:hypothetical protein